MYIPQEQEGWATPKIPIQLREHWYLNLSGLYCKESMAIVSSDHQLKKSVCFSCFGVSSEGAGQPHCLVTLGASGSMFLPHVLMPGLPISCLSAHALDSGLFQAPAGTLFSHKLFQNMQHHYLSSTFPKTKCFPPKGPRHLMWEVCHRSGAEKAWSQF